MTSNRIRPHVTPVTAAAETLLARHGLNAEDVANQRADRVLDVERSGYWQEVAREIDRIARRTKHSKTIHRTRDRAGRVRHYVVRFGKRYPMSEQEVREARNFGIGWTVVDDETIENQTTTPTKESETMTENQNQTETPTRPESLLPTNAPFCYLVDALSVVTLDPAIAKHLDPKAREQIVAAVRVVDPDRARQIEESLAAVSPAPTLEESLAAVSPAPTLETFREEIVAIARFGAWTPSERLERIASRARRVEADDDERNEPTVDAPPTNDLQIRNLRLRAWDLADRAALLLRDYAVTAENYEQPRMSDDAIDAGDLAAKIEEYSHRYQDAADERNEPPYACGLCGRRSFDSPDRCPGCEQHGSIVRA